MKLSKILITFFVPLLVASHVSAANLNWTTDTNIGAIYTKKNYTVKATDVITVKQGKRIFIKNGTLTVNGTINGNIHCAAGATVVVNGTGIINISDKQYLRLNDTANLKSTGTVNINSGATLKIEANAKFEHGKLNIDGATVILLGSLSSGDLTISGVTNFNVDSKKIGTLHGEPGVITINSGSTATINSMINNKGKIKILGTLTTKETFANTGTLDISAGTFNFDKATLDEGTIVLNGGSIIPTAAVNIGCNFEFNGGTFGDNVTIYGIKPIVKEKTITIPTTVFLNVPIGKTFTTGPETNIVVDQGAELVSAGAIISNSAITNKGLILASKDGKFTSNGALTNDPTAKLVSKGSFISDGGITNNGLISAQEGGTFTGKGKLINQKIVVCHKDSKIENVVEGAGAFINHNIMTEEEITTSLGTFVSTPVVVVTPGPNEGDGDGGDTGDSGDAGTGGSGSGDTNE